MPKSSIEMPTPSRRKIGRISSWKWVLATKASSVRSEERRVGKECRSLCDWSSDVCSSDLIADAEIVDRNADAEPPEDRQDLVLEMGFGDKGVFRQIGRASCRERV